MKPLVFICLFFLLLSCTERKLGGTSWNLIEASYGDKPVQIGTPGSVVIAFEGETLNAIEFYEDGSVKLPGLNSPDIYATWTIVDNQIHFTFDSIRYGLFHYEKVDMEFLASKDSILEASVDDDIPKKEVATTNEADSGLLRIIGSLNHDPRESKAEVLAAIKVYQGPFMFAFRDGKLFMMSHDSKLIAEKAKTIGDI